MSKKSNKDKQNKPEAQKESDKKIHKHMKPVETDEYEEYYDEE